MKKIIIASVLLGLISCHKESSFSNIKNNLLYKDEKSNIYLKRKEYIKSEDNVNHQAQYFYFDRVDYRDSTYHLKDMVDIKSFNLVKYVTDTIKGRKFDKFEDKRHIYIFQYYPPTFTKIKATDK